MTKAHQNRLNGDIDAWQYTLALIEQSFRLARPDARSFAEKERVRYLEIAITLQRRGPWNEDKARYYQDRAGAIAEIMKRHRKRALYSEGNAGPLAEATTQPARRDPITTLVARNRISFDHEVAARQIAQCYEGICSSLMPKVRDLGTFVPPPKGSGRKPPLEMPRKLWDLYSETYVPWTADMIAQKQNLPMILDIVVDGVAIDNARRMQRPMLSWRDCLSALIHGLDLWIERAR